jgi:hypothetical protein
MGKGNKPKAVPVSRSSGGGPPLGATMDMPMTDEAFGQMKVTDPENPDQLITLKELHERNEKMDASWKASELEHAQAVKDRKKAQR